VLNMLHFTANQCWC